MTKIEVATAISEGKKIHVVEFRNHTAETITWRDKETRKSLSGAILSFACEAGNSAFVVSERTAENWNPATYVCPYKKGDKVALLYTSCQVASGKTTYYGRLEPITGDKPGTVTI